MRYAKQLSIALAPLLVAAAACGSDNDVLGSSPSGTVAPEVAADLTFLREEEKLARDVYLELESVWGSMIFQNISQAEQQHMDQVAIRLAALGLPDPMTDNTLGVFNNQVLADLYAQLVSQGKLSETEALVVGVTIEDLDIRDIQQMATRTSDPATLVTYARLQCGSRNHMRAFVSRLEALAVPYQVQFITAEYFSEILATPQERCGVQP